MVPYISFKTNSSLCAARNKSITVLHSFLYSNRPHSIPFMYFDRYTYRTLLCKTCIETTSEITHSNRVIDARYCPILSSLINLLFWNDYKGDNVCISFKHLIHKFLFCHFFLFFVFHADSMCTQLRVGVLGATRLKIHHNHYNYRSLNYLQFKICFGTCIGT